MKYRHILAHLHRFVILMLVINHLIPTHQNSKPLLMSQYTMLTHISFLEVLDFVKIKSH